MRMGLEYLSDLEGAGTIILRRDTFEVLFFTDGCEKIVPGLAVGAKCPLDIAGGAPQVAAVAPCSMGGAPAYAVTVGSDEMFGPRLLLEALATRLTTVMLFNLTRNTFSVISRDEQNALPFREGAFDQLIAQTVGLLDPADREAYLAMHTRPSLLEAMRNGRRHFSLEARQRGPDGALHWYRFGATRVADSPEGDVRVIGTRHLIDREKAEELHNINLQRLLYHSMRRNLEFIYLIDVKTGRFERLSAKPGSGELSVMTGDYQSRLDEYAGKSLPPEEIAPFQANMSLSVMLQKMTAPNGAHTHIYRAREGFELRWKEAKFYFVDEGMQQIALNVRDIQDAQMALRKQTTMQRTFAGALRNSYDAIFELDLTADIVYTVTMTEDGLSRERLHELPASQIENWRAETSVHPDDREMFLAAFSLDNLRNAMLSGQDAVYRELRRRIGCEPDYEWYAHTAQWLVDEAAPDHLVTMLYLKNIDRERRAAEAQRQALVDALNLARLASNAKSDFLSSMSHEIRTPMNAIIGMTEIAKRTAGDPERLMDSLNKIEASSKYLLLMINDTLDLARIESRKVTVAREPFALGELISEIEGISRQQATLKQIDFTVVNDAPEYEIIGDRGMVSRILMNIVSNAIKYTHPKGTVRLSAHEERRDGGMAFLRFTVEDTGIGMNADFIEHIFEPFAQGKNVKETLATGTGLGMAITKSLADAIDASIRVESCLGKGSRFTVDMPLEIGRTLRETKPAKPPSTGADGLRGKRVLLAEDNPINAEIAVTLLEMEGLLVDHAENGRLAVDRFLTLPPGTFDAVLMDIQMPVMNGLEAARAIRATGRADAAAVPIIAMTANAFQEDVTRALSSGMNDYITKPFEIRKLTAMLGSHINRA